MKKALMIQGTSSGAGKSLITAAFCRIFSDEGIRVAPFKAQNMALNSAITAEGGEIGRAQALQARAARVDSLNDMNPVLLKVAGGGLSQVIIHGRVYATMTARDYYAFREKAWSAVTDSYARLARCYDLIILEGAGSPAEINLLDVDIVNMAMARHARAPVLLVADIDKGGVFASLYGTLRLLGRHGRRIKGFLINKFRGDRTILDPGLEMLHRRTGRPTIGVLPYVSDMGLPEEDGFSLPRRTPVQGREPSKGVKVRVIVVRLQFISNFTDFDPFHLEPDVELLYSDRSSDIENADIVILPGSKNTVSDLIFLKEQGLADGIRRAFHREAQVIGICGGYQMLGKRILDPYGMESTYGSVEGLGLLDIETLLGREKHTCRVEARVLQGERFGVGPEVLSDKDTLRGYEIHLGESKGDIGLFSFRSRCGGEIRERLDGSMRGNCWGTYLHGVFDHGAFRRGIIDNIRKKKGMPPGPGRTNYEEWQERALDRLAGIVRDNVDMKFVRGMLNL